jgi:putative component of membrane protein insertase Oxa1/YidC/SpoIIIJ protein YidD
MILAIEKYGIAKGVLKGIQRLSKCRYPNGGVDYP